MNRTQRITSDWLLQSGLVGDELLLEALLRRGFLAYRDDQGVWLGTGSHPADLDVLRLIAGLEVESISGHTDRMARVKWEVRGVLAMAVAVAIVALPENHFGGHSRWTRCGVADFVNGTWGHYRKMEWGAKLPTCPMQKRGCSVVSNALDLGVALLVKTFPLARVATAASCDGHGERPALISFHFDWDSYWGKAVFDVLEYATPNSTWIWGTEGGSGLHVSPHIGFGDAEMVGMLNDIQHFARQLLNQCTIDKIGRARVKTLEAFGNSPPSAGHFAQEAQHQLAKEFA
jgi:hypothetical protein